MATTSFTLRKTTVGAGSYLQNNGDDSALRSDQYISVVNPLGGESTFSANIINAQEVYLSWELSFVLSASSNAAAPIALAIVASTTGEPVTVKDGAFVTKVTSNSVFDYTDIVRTSAGRWVYYSLFVEYSDFGSPSPITWYERVASLYIQIPKPLQSLDNLWSRIPEYYKELDAGLPTNPLYNFMELFGWEIDRTRTLIETIALSNDPDIAVTPALAELAYQTGLETTIDVVGTTKVRALLQNIGYIRKRKGTVESIAYYLSALTGCRISYYTSTVDGVTQHRFLIMSQRINLIADPKFTQALGAATTATTPFKTYQNESSTYGIHTYAPTSASAASVTASGTSVIISVPNTGTGNTVATVYSKTPFLRSGVAYYYTAFDGACSGGASFNKFELATTTYYNDTLTPSAGQSIPHNLTIQPQLLPPDIFNPSYTRVELPPLDTNTFESSYPYLVFVIPPGGSVVLKNWLVEPFSLGEYFDGNTREGGLIPATSGYGVGSSDYRWEGTTNQSFSFYTLDYKRVFDISENLIKNYIAPVTIKDNIVLIWNYYYGKSI